MKDKIIEILRGARKRCLASGGGFCIPEIRVEGCAYAQYGEDCALHVMADELVAQGATVCDKGEWISLTDCSNAGVYCSVCQKKVWKEDYAWCNKKNRLRSNYCPNCGARMDGDTCRGQRDG